MYGIGLAEHEFRAAVEAGRLTLHREIRQSVDLIARALGLAVERIDEERSPVLEDGVVVGFRHVAYGRPAIELELSGSLRPLDPGGTTVEIEGDPDLSVRIDGGVTTHPERVVAARVVNVLDWLATMPPGLRSPAELPVALRVT
jgi:hypothetical protein